MTATTQGARRAPARAGIRSVAAAALGTYRRRFGWIVLAALAVFAPLDLVVTVATEAVKSVAERHDLLGSLVVASGTSIGVAGTTLSLIFFTGVIERIVATDQLGDAPVSLGEILRGLPTGRLVLAAIVTTVLVVIGLVLLVVPGIVLWVLFAIVGPVIVIEDRPAISSLWRSARLVWPHFLLVFVVILLPAWGEEGVTSWLERLRWYEHPIVHLSADVTVTLLIGGLVGVLEVTAAYALIADEKIRLQRRAAGRDAASGTGAPQLEDGEAR